jgi:hypothetical protein
VRPKRQKEKVERQYEMTPARPGAEPIGWTVAEIEHAQEPRTGKLGKKGKAEAPPQQPMCAWGWGGNTGKREESEGRAGEEVREVVKKLAELAKIPLKAPAVSPRPAKKESTEKVQQGKLNVSPTPGYSAGKNESTEKVRSAKLKRRPAVAQPEEKINSSPKPSDSALKKDSLERGAGVKNESQQQVVKRNESAAKRESPEKVGCVVKPGDPAVKIESHQQVGSVVRRADPAVNTESQQRVGCVVTTEDQAVNPESQPKVGLVVKVPESAVKSESQGTVGCVVRRPDPAVSNESQEKVGCVVRRTDPAVNPESQPKVGLVVKVPESAEKNESQGTVGCVVRRPDPAVKNESQEKVGCVVKPADPAAKNDSQEPVGKLTGPAVQKPSPGRVTSSPMLKEAAANPGVGVRADPKYKATPGLFQGMPPPPKGFVFNALQGPGANPPPVVGPSSPAKTTSGPTAWKTGHDRWESNKSNAGPVSAAPKEKESEPSSGTGKVPGLKGHQWTPAAHASSKWGSAKKPPPEQPPQPDSFPGPFPDKQHSAPEPKHDSRVGHTEGQRLAAPPPPAFLRGNLGSQPKAISTPSTSCGKEAKVKETPPQALGEEEEEEKALPLAPAPGAWGLGQWGRPPGINSEVNWGRNLSFGHYVAGIGDGRGFGANQKPP